MSEDKKYVIDTNSLINNPYIILDKDVVVTSLVLRELEKLELRRNDRTLQYSIRVAKRMVEDNLNNKKIEIRDIDNCGVLEGYAEDYVDNKLIKYAVEKGYGIITDDILLKHKAVSMGVEVIKSSDQEEDIEYKGFIEKELDKEMIQLVYANHEMNMFSLLTNQYLIMKDDSNGEVVDIMVWTGGWLESIYKPYRNNRTIPQTSSFERVESKDHYQAMVIDSLYRNQVTMVRGRAGSGKTLLALSYAWNLIEKKDGRLVIFFNPAPSKDSITMGFNKGSKIEKAMQSSLGSMLKSKFGDEYEVERLIEEGAIEIMPFTDLRGWDSKSDRETVVLISEAQNLTSELLKMGLQRIDETAKVIIDGDYNQQIDRDSYLYSNGMKRASEVLRGSHLYGEIELQQTYRSELADIADGM